MAYWLNQGGEEEELDGLPWFSSSGVRKTRFWIVACGSPGEETGSMYYSDTATHGPAVYKLMEVSTPEDEILHTFPRTMPIEEMLRLAEIIARLHE